MAADRISTIAPQRTTDDSMTAKLTGSDSKIKIINVKRVRVNSPTVVCNTRRTICGSRFEILTSIEFHSHSN